MIVRRYFITLLGVVEALRSKMFDPIHTYPVKEDIHWRCTKKFDIPGDRY